MFLLDDIFLAPLKGLTVVCRKVQEAAVEEMASQEKTILADLAELHHLLDAGRIGDDDFNLHEGQLLDRLEACRQELEEETEDTKTEV